MDRARQIEFIEKAQERAEAAAAKLRGHPKSKEAVKNGREALIKYYQEAKVRRKN